MKKLKQIFAIIGVIGLIGLHIATLIVAIVDSSSTMNMLKACLVATIIIPALMWAYSLIYRLTHKKDDINNTDNSTNSSKKETSN